MNETSSQNSKDDEEKLVAIVKENLDYHIEWNDKFDTGDMRYRQAGRGCSMGGVRIWIITASKKDKSDYDNFFASLPSEEKTGMYGTKSHTYKVKAKSIPPIMQMILKKYDAVNECNKNIGRFAMDPYTVEHNRHSHN